MIPQSRSAALAAIAVAVVAHAGGLTGLGSKEAVLIEGGGDVEKAALGAAFADMTAGTLVPAASHEARQPPLEPVEPLQQAAPEKPDAVANPAEVAAPVRQRPQKLPAVVPIAADQVGKDEAVKPVETAKAIVPEPVTPLEAAPPQPEMAPPANRLASVRPASRPAMATPAEQKPGVKQRPKPEPSVAVQPGNNTQNVKKGTETGTQPRGSENAQRSDVALAVAGNAAASNYPGLVKRRIHRARRKSVNVRGSARVRFRIADNGTLASVSISRSSGSRRLDQVALAQVRAAAPFPKPPAGARRQFSVEIKGS